MFSEFEYTIIRGDDEFSVTVEYSAISVFGDVDIDILAIIGEDGLGFDTTDEEDMAIIRACFERVDDDFEDDAASYGDYVNDLRSGIND